nr:hypothetical protein [Tanacetum cinerariifolium]
MHVLAPTTVASLTLSAPTLTPLTIPTISTVPQAPTPLTTTLSTVLQDLPNFGSLSRFDHRLKTLEANFSVFVQTNQFARAVSLIVETGDIDTLKRRRDDEADKDEEPLLDQTGGPRGEKKARSQSQQALQMRKRPGLLASLYKGLNLNK